MSAQCEFCGQIEGGRENNALWRLLDTEWAEKPILARRGRAVVMPSVGALVPGHVLVCPVDHDRSVVSSKARDDVAALAVETKSLLADRLALPVHAFEHGSGSDGGRVACSIEHAHLHLVPTEADPLPLLESLLPVAGIGPGLEVLERAVGPHEYLLYEAPDQERWLARTEDGFKSQLMRQIFAKTMGREHTWNWREAPARNNVEATVALLEGQPAGWQPASLQHA